MRLAIMQPYFFPYVGYFQAIHAVDKYILYENLDYIKDGWMHRNRILSVAGKPQYIGAQLDGKSSNAKIRDIRLNSSLVWRRKLKNAFFLNYKRAAFFDETFSLLEELIDHDTEFLHQYNSAGIIALCRHIGIDTEIVSDNSKYRTLENELDALYESDLNRIPEKKVERVLRMCKEEGATDFVNAIGGQQLYRKEVFLQKDISLHFVETGQISYRQFSDDFYPSLSIIDMLMHNGVKNTYSLILQYNLI